MSGIESVDGRRTEVVDGVKGNIPFGDIVCYIVDQRSCIGAGPNELDIHITSYQRENCWIEIVDVWM